MKARIATAVLVIAALLVAACAQQTPAPAPKPAPSPSPAPAPSPAPSPTPAPSPSPTAKPSPAPAPAAREVTILNLSDLTGRMSSINIPATAMMQGWVDYTNSKGGIVGKNGKVTLKLMVADTQYDVAKAKESWARAKDAGAIAAWHMMSGLAEGLYPDAEKDKIPLVSGSWGLKAPWSEWCYGTGHPGLPDCTGTEGVMAMKKIVGPNASKLGFLSEDAPFAPMFLQGIDDFLKAQNVTLYKEIFPAGAPDTTANLLRLKNSGVDAIYFICSVAGMATANKDYNRLGMTVPVIHSNCTGAADLAAIGGWDFIEGRYFANFYVPIDTGSKFQGKGHQLARDIFKQYRPNEPVRDNAIYALIGCLVIGGAIQKALDSVTPDKLDGAALKQYGLDMLDNLDMMGLSYNVSYKPGNDHPGPNNAHIWKVDKSLTDGKLAGVGDWFPYTKIKPKV